jgi:acetyl-CoA synthetase
MRSSGVFQNYKMHWKKASYTGEPIDAATLEFLDKALNGLPICSMYGTTEVGVVLVNYPGAPDFKVKPGSLGKPCPHVKIKILRGDRTEANPREIAEICCWRRNDWYPTKDLGYVDEDGYFYHCGRADDVIISAGWTMSAVEIEDALMKHPDVTEAAAIGVKDAMRGQVVKAFIVGKRNDETFRKELQDFTRTRLSQHEYPRVIEFVAELPKTPAGKVNRKVLRDREKALEAETSAKGLQNVG